MRWSLQELQAHTSIDQATVHIMLREDLHMLKIAAKWVPCALTEQQKWCHYETSRFHLKRYQNEGENLLNNIITIDETWVRAYEPELKRQSAEWRHEGSSRRQKFRQNLSPVKLMVILAYDVQGVILCHFVTHRETVNAQYYAAYLQNHLRRSVRRKRPQLQNVIFYIIILLHIRRFVSGICYDVRSGKYWSIHHTHRTFRLAIMI